MKIFVNSGWLLAALVFISTTAGADPLFHATSAQGIKLQISSDLNPLRINQIHSWRLRLSDPQDRPISAAQIQVTGGMPLHDHGLPTAPQVTDEIEAGVYLLQGMRFHMPGEWELVVKVRHGDMNESFLIAFAL